MVLKVYTVYDSKAELYLQPFCVQTKGQALRAFGDTANDKQSNIGKNPEDYTLFELGSYDDCSAKYTLHPTPMALGVAIEFIKS